jgi:hypothetical protein
MRRAVTDIVTSAGGMPVISAALAEGKALQQIADGLGVSRSALCEYIGADAGRRLARTRARAEAADKLAEDVLLIADTATVEDEKVAKLRMEARKWLAGKWDPQGYGEQHPSLTVNIAAAHLNDLRGLLVAGQHAQQALDVSDAMVIDDASMQDDRPAISVSNVKRA